MAASLTMSQLSRQYDEALQGFVTYLPFSEMRFAAAVSRPLAAACVAEVMHQSCQRGEAAKNEAKKHLGAIENGDETRSTEEVKEDVSKAMDFMRSADAKLDSSCLSFTRAIGVPGSSAVRVESATSFRILQELSRILEDLLRQLRREKLTSGWESYFNIYGSMGHKLSSNNLEVIRNNLDTMLQQ